jgi:hypothetical protein
MFDRSIVRESVFLGGILGNVLVNNDSVVVPIEPADRSERSEYRSCVIPYSSDVIVCPLAVLGRRVAYFRTNQTRDSISPLFTYLAPHIISRLTDRSDRSPERLRVRGQRTRKTCCSSLFLHQTSMPTSGEYRFSLRATHRKSRLGCNTCKQRRVKVCLITVAVQPLHDRS